MSRWPGSVKSEQRCGQTRRARSLVRPHFGWWIAVLGGLRKELVELQRRFAETPPGAVLDGRDIGTVICPDAEVKLFVTASDQTRAQRRFEELVAGGKDTTLDQVQTDLRIRDARDAERDTAPMRQAEDAHLLDTTELTIDAAIAKAASIIRSALPG